MSEKKPVEREFVRDELLTVPIVSLNHVQILRCEITGEMFTAEQNIGGGEYDEAPTMAPIINLETGEAGQLICGSVLKNVLEMQNDGYVGGWFEIIQEPIADGKKYHSVKLWRLKKNAS